MIDNCRSAQGFLLTTTPEMREMKDEVVKSLILKITRDSELTARQIYEKLNEDFDIKLDNVFFQKYLGECLKEKGLLRIAREGEIIYKPTEEREEFIKSIQLNNDILIKKLIERIELHTPSDLKVELREYEKDICIDFLQSFSSMIDENFSEVIVKRDLPPLRKEPKLKCKVRGISDKLRDSLANTYINIYQDRTFELFEQLISISLFWNSFVKISSLNERQKGILLEQLDNMKLISDSNALIAYCCNYHKHNDFTYEYFDSIMDNLGIKIFYTDRTKEELKGFLEKIKRAVKSLDYYPENSYFIAKEIDESFTSTYFFNNYVSWERFENEFWEKIFGKFHLIDKEYIEKAGISQDELNNLESIIVKDVCKYMMKSRPIAEHDAYLIALTRLLREKRSTGWFDFTDWIVTLDTRFLRLEKFVGQEGKEPYAVSFFVKFIPLYFHHYYFLKSFSLNSFSAIKNIYEILYYSAYELETKSDRLKEIVLDVTKIKNKEAFRGKFLEFYKEDLKTILKEINDNEQDSQI
jgi:hypothetical protein